MCHLVRNHQHKITHQIKKKNSFQTSHQSILIYISTDKFKKSRNPPLRKTATAELKEPQLTEMERSQNLPENTVGAGSFFPFLSFHCFLSTPDHTNLFIWIHFWGYSEISAYILGRVTILICKKGAKSVVMKKWLWCIFYWLISEPT